jgi:Sec-independent protein translocase protein TatA
VGGVAVVKALLWVWGKIKTVPGWVWLAILVVGAVVAGVLKWRSMQRRLTAALERARSAERALEIDRTAVEEHAKVDAKLDVELERIDEDTEERLDEYDDKAEAVEAAEDKSDGSLADLANEHFGNEG